MSISEQPSHERSPGDRIARHAGLTGVATPIVQLRRLCHFRQRRPHLTSQEIRLGAAIGGSLAALAIMATILGVEAFGDAVEMARSRLRKWLGK